MKFLKLKLHENCQMLAVVDDADNILSAATFTSSQDTEAAEGFAHTLLANLGLVKTADLPRTKTVAELLDAIEETCGTFTAYVKDLAPLDFNVPIFGEVRFSVFSEQKNLA